MVFKMPGFNAREPLNLSSERLVFQSLPSQIRNFVPLRRGAGRADDSREAYQGFPGGRQRGGRGDAGGGGDGGRAGGTFYTLALFTIAFE
jgi:hypothetical protein